MVTASRDTRDPKHISEYLKFSESCEIERRSSESHASRGLVYFPCKSGSRAERRLVTIMFCKFNLFRQV